MDKDLNGDLNGLNGLNSGSGEGLNNGLSKDLNISLLMDFYGQLLTEKQLTALNLYYNQDLSLAEIAEEMEISRQGARDFIKHGEARLRKFEDKLGLAERFTDITGGIRRLKSIIESPEIPNGVRREAAEILDKISENL